MRLADVSYGSGKMEYRSRHATEPESALQSYLEEARTLMAGAPEAFAGMSVQDPPLNGDFEALRWFSLPGEALAELLGQANTAPAPELMPNFGASR